MPDDDVYRRAIPWTPHTQDDPRPLGRNVHHDPKSWDHRHVSATPGQRNPVQHVAPLAVLDQAAQGSCVGHAGTRGLASHPVRDGLPGTIATQLGHPFAVTLYSDCEKADGGAGLPTEDEGTSGTTCGNVLKRRGQIGSFTNTFDLAAALDALQDYALLIGINWHTGGDRPDSHGIIDAISGAVRGGHEVIVDEFVPAGSPLGGGAVRLDGTPFGDGHVATEDMIGMTNSWSESYGYRGRMYMTVVAFGRLLDEEGDVTILHPAGAMPPPAPELPPFWLAIWRWLVGLFTRQR
jgi:hypothetical protein